MPCPFCGKSVFRLKRKASDGFCSKDHRASFELEKTRLVLARLTESTEPVSLGSASPVAVPLKIDPVIPSPRLGSLLPVLPHAAAYGGVPSRTQHRLTLIGAVPVQRAIGRPRSRPGLIERKSYSLSLTPAPGRAIASHFETPKLRLSANRQPMTIHTQRLTGVACRPAASRCRPFSLQGCQPVFRPRKARANLLFTASPVYAKSRVAPVGLLPPVPVPEPERVPPTRMEICSPIPLQSVRAASPGVALVRSDTWAGMRVLQFPRQWGVSALALSPDPLRWGFTIKNHLRLSELEPCPLTVGHCASAGGIRSIETRRVPGWKLSPIAPEWVAPPAETTIREHSSFWPIRISKGAIAGALAVPLCIAVFVCVVRTAPAAWTSVRRAISSRAAIEFEDDFRSGLSAWEGTGESSRSWAYDRNGFLHPGKLMLWRPSLGLRNYNLEFTIQMSRGGVSWVVRAANLRSYYATKINVWQSGPLPRVSITHFAVFNGKRGPVTTLPVPLNVRNQTMYKVQMSVNGNNFWTAVDGQILDSWSDDRLQSGGVGFFSENGDTALLRSVRVADRDDWTGRLCAYLSDSSADR